jgi:hypothetical protein
MGYIRDLKFAPGTSLSQLSLAFVKGLLPCLLSGEGFPLDVQVRTGLPATVRGLLSAPVSSTTRTSTGQPESYRLIPKKGKWKETDDRAQIGTLDSKYRELPGKSV